MNRRRGSRLRPALPEPLKPRPSSECLEDPLRGLAGIDLFTTVPAEMMAPLWMMTPGITKTLAPSHTSSSITTSLASHPCSCHGVSGSSNRWFTDQTLTSGPKPTQSPMRTPPPPVMNAPCPRLQCEPMETFSGVMTRRPCCRIVSDPRCARKRGIHQARMRTPSCSGMPDSSHSASSRISAFRSQKMVFTFLSPSGPCDEPAAAPSKAPRERRCRARCPAHTASRRADRARAGSMARSGSTVRP